MELIVARVFDTASTLCLYSLRKAEVGLSQVNHDFHNIYFKEELSHLKKLSFVVMIVRELAIIHVKRIFLSYANWEAIEPSATHSHTCVWQLMFMSLRISEIVLCLVNLMFL